MQLNWCKLLYVILTLVCLVSSQNATSVKLRIVNVTASSNKIFNDIYLKCEVQGNPSPDVWWTKTGSYVHGYNVQFQDENRTLIISMAAFGDIGTYYCHARNNVSYINASFVLSLIDPPYARIFTQNDYLELYSWQKDVRIGCNGAGYPNVQVTWKRNGIKILDSLNSSLNTRVYQQIYQQGLTYVFNYLHFKEFYCHDAGNYTCETSIDGYDYVDTQSIELICLRNFSQSILFTPLSSTTIVPTPTSSLDSYLVIPSLIGNFTQLRSKVVINLTTTPTLSSTLLMPTPSFKNIGRNSTQLTSTVINFIITPTPSSTLYSLATSSISIVPIPTSLYVTPINPTVVENSSIVLSCNCGCSIRPHWFKNNQSIRYDGAGSPYTLLENGSLHINASRWTRYTAGNYSCEIRAFSWRVRSKQVKLEVWYLDDCYVTGDEEIYRGQNINLTCQGNGFPYPTFIWYLHGQQLKTNSRIRIQENQLNIFNATINDGGEYICVASNQVGKVWHGVNIIVRDIPSVGISSNASKYTLEGTAIRFTCQREDRLFRRIQKIELVKDGIPFYQRLALVQVHSLFWYYTTKWYSARQNDTGKYQCKVTIGATSRYSSPFYLIVGIPSGHIVLEKEPETSTTGIKLSWKPISRKFWNGKQVTFEVTVSSVDHTLQKSYVTKTTSAIISGLRPATTYIVSVAGSTVFGPIQNVTVTAKTKENKNSKKFQLRIRLTNYEFSNNLLDRTSSQYKNLESKLQNSLGDIFKSSPAIKFQYIGSSVSRFEYDKRSVVVLVVVSLDSQFKNSNSPILVQELNKVSTLAGYRFDKSYTSEEDFDECENADSNTCHEYAHCDNAVGTYICRCFEGFFGDGKECQGPPQITSKSPANITQFVETNVTLVCTVIAYPNPTTSWKRIDPDGKFIEIKRTSKKSDGNYTIYNARLQDSGKYLCNASNTLGYVSYTTEIIIKPVIVNISVEIKLSNKTFKEELKNKSSPAYKELEKDVYTELYNFFNNTPGFEDVEILGFTNGSVKVIFRVIVKVLKPSKETNDVVAVKVGWKVYKQLKTGRIGNILVIPDAIKLKVPPPPPANVTYSDVKETRVHIYWDPPELHELFSIERYYITYLKHGEKKWSNNTINNVQYTNVQLDNLESDTFYILKIIAKNAYGLGKESSRMEIKTMKVKVISSWYYIGPIIAVACVTLLVTIICLVRRVSLSRAWMLVEDGNLNSVKEEPKASFEMTERTKLDENTFTNVGFSDTLAKSAWKDILRTSIEISNETLIPGEFGVTVVRGTFSCSLEKRKESCSVKMLKENATAEDRRDLTNELTIISAISCHENIVNLIGACTSKDGPLLLVLEFCSCGTLESNLRESRKNTQMFMKKNKINLANEIAKGMRHLADARIVNRNLAAKNILMTNDFVPKISNFGLSRDIYERGSYHKLVPGDLPTRWLAIESLTDGLYTTKSDVWSFAVVMWEIETGGDIPYQECEITELVSQINKGYRLSKPEETSNEAYKLMLQSWDANPDHRPTFHEIVEITQMYLGNDKSLIDVPLNN